MTKEVWSQNHGGTNPRSITRGRVALQTDGRAPANHASTHHRSRSRLGGHGSRSTIAESSSVFNPSRTQALGENRSGPVRETHMLLPPRVARGLEVARVTGCWGALGTTAFFASSASEHGHQTGSSSTIKGVCTATSMKACPSKPY